MKKNNQNMWVKFTTLLVTVVSPLFSHGFDISKPFEQLYLGSSKVRLQEVSGEFSKNRDLHVGGYGLLSPRVTYGFDAYYLPGLEPESNKVRFQKDHYGFSVHLGACYLKYLRYRASLGSGLVAEHVQQDIYGQKESHLQWGLEAIGKINIDYAMTKEVDFGAQVSSHYRFNWEVFDYSYGFHIGYRL